MSTDGGAPGETDREAVLRAGLGVTLERTDLRGLGRRIEGKVRDIYLPGDGTRILVATDRISAFDRVLGTLPFKGQVLNQLSAYWFSQVEDIADHHLLATPDPAVSVVTECTPLPVEWVMRAYLTGVTPTSIYAHYRDGARVFCGHKLPDGLRKDDPLPHPILTPSTKAPQGGHDQSVSKAELLARGTIDEATFDRAEALSHALFARGQALCKARGLILVDTKYELGLAPDGRLMVIDEIHTPDSSRFYFADSYRERRAQGLAPESFDKEHVRRWLAKSGFEGEGRPPPLTDEVRIEAAARYIDACEAIWGRTFQPDLRDPQRRIRGHLKAT